MQRCIYKIISIFLSVIFLVGITSCGKKHIEPINYDLYLNKIWIAENWLNGGDDNLFYFRINRVEGEDIEGWYSTKNYLYTSAVSIVNFSGKILNGVAECQVYGYGNIGTLQLTFLEDDRIEADIYFEENNFHNENLFRPYNLSDVETFVLNADLQKTIELNSGESICVAAGRLDTNKPIPVIYITNAQGDILYDLNASYQVASEVYEIVVEDFNKDGFNDINIITYFPYEEDSIFIDHLFYWTKSEYGGYFSHEDF